MEVKVQNEYNDWHYTNGVLYLAMLELAEKTGDKKYEELFVDILKHFVLSSRLLAKNHRPND